MKVRDLPELDRPRERLLRSGAPALSDRELLALLLGSGLPGTDAIELAAELIADAGGLRLLAVADPHALRQRPGVGAAKAARVAAAFELARRTVTADERRRISGSSDVAIVVAPYLSGRRHERVVVVVCDNCGSVLRVAPLTDGAADRALISVRDVLSAVLAAGGTRFAVAHNHPSGSVEPSAVDIEVTGRLRAAAETVGLRFLDHVIVTETDWRRVP
jgi:DNA repair protein RadC